MFVCPVCKEPESYVHLSFTRWFTFFFVPVFPIHRVGEHVECQACHSRFDPTVVQAATSDAVVIASLVDKWGIDDPAVMSELNSTSEAFRPTLTAAPQISGLATISLILGVLSLPLLCFCGLSAVSSLGAIVTGHWALANIRRAAGTLQGRTQAIVGLILGYVMMVVTIGVFAFIKPAVQDALNREQQQAAARRPTADNRLREAEMRVLTGSTEDTATGNSPIAKTLAKDYAEALTTMRRNLFTKAQDGFSLTQGNFVVHCELAPQSCAFIVHVPSYRKFTDEAKEQLEDLAWQLGEEVAASKLTKGDRLAVGLRGTAIYGAVMIGQIGADNNATYGRANRDALLEFFDSDEAL